MNEPQRDHRLYRYCACVYLVDSEGRKEVKDPYLLAGIFRRVLTILGVLCSCRNTSRAFRGQHGRDYVRCLDCGRQHDSAIQFGYIDESWRRQ